MKPVKRAAALRITARSSNDNLETIIAHFTPKNSGFVGTFILSRCPIGKQMVLSFGKDDALLRQAIKNLTEPEPRKGLAEHPGIVESDKRLPAARKMELHLWVSEIMKFMKPAAGEELVGAGPAVLFGKFDGG